MDKSNYRLFILTITTIVILVAAGYAPSLFPDFKKVDILGDVLLDKETIAKMHSDSIKAQRDKEIEDSLAKIHKLKGGHDKFFADYSQGSEHGFQTFYKALDSLKVAGRPVRIAYFGDSYIESDILTADLRMLLQDKFGGGGAGWVDCGVTTNIGRNTVKQISSGFETFVAADPANFNSSRQGISQRYSTLTNGNGTITFRGSADYRHCDAWNTSEILFRSPNGGTFTCTTDAGTKTFKANASREVQSLKVTGKTTSAKWEIISTGVTIFGASNENSTGVTVDNFAMRGCSGLTVAGIPDNTLEEFNKIRDYDLIILQYGLNAVSPSCGEKWFANYFANMCKITQKIMKAYPHTTILIMSIPPRGRKLGSEIVTMKGIEEMVECHKHMAQENKVAFMNLYELLGGANASSGLASKGFVNHDLTHISRAGGKYVAKKIYDELMKRY